VGQGLSRKELVHIRRTSDLLARGVDCEHEDEDDDKEYSRVRAGLGCLLELQNGHTLRLTSHKAVWIAFRQP
jgi:hypothetical protein